MYLWLVILQASTSWSHYTKLDLYHYNLIQDAYSITIDVDIIKPFRKEPCYIFINWKIAIFFYPTFQWWAKVTWDFSYLKNKVFIRRLKGISHKQKIITMSNGKIYSVFPFLSFQAPVRIPIFCCFPSMILIFYWNWLSDNTMQILDQVFVAISVWNKKELLRIIL